MATNFQDLVAKLKNVVALAPVLGAISRPVFGVEGLNKVMRGKVMITNLQWEEALIVKWILLFNTRKMYGEEYREHGNWC